MNKGKTKEKEGNGILCIFHFQKEIFFYSRECTLLLNIPERL